MKAKIEGLNEKYYGTIVHIVSDNGHSYSFSLWNSDDYYPSERELDIWGVTPEQYEENETVNDGWGGSAPAREVVEICDSHFESRETYETAKKIVELINGKADD